ncbi:MULTISPECIES: glycosyl hydrolase family 28-related protein [Paenibacillus]|uniref:glycosyl hydrolase family 28-related protein n=1 Tax=Paenibacillus TaxID=44249 RepID=UPI00096E3B8C|nr:glycosyl hydrolase family 28-related protein [Paenibacillus amylolyticus]OMF47706.1 hypothetical protein BK136_02105 [Paenibacillus amylolyticus]
MPTVSELMSQNNTNAMMNYRLWGNLTYVVTAYDIFPDGTDVTNKLQALVNLANSQGRTAIFFPAGEYFVTYINNDENIYYFGDNAKFVGGYTKKIEQIGSSSETMYVSVKDFGAVGDGVTDDTSAFQNAIQQLSTGNGGTLFLPKGKYLVKQTMNITKAISILGEGSDSTDMDGFTPLYLAVSAIVWGGTATEILKVTGLVGGLSWSNFVIDGQNLASIGVSLDQLRNSTWSNVKIIRCATGLKALPVDGGSPNKNTMFNVFTDLAVLRCGVCVDLGGTGISNVCHNTFINLQVDYTGTDGIIMGDTDNNQFTTVYGFARGATGYTVRLKNGSRSNYFMHFQGSAKAESGSNNIIFGYDRENGQTRPVVDTGAKLFWTENGNNATAWRMTTAMEALSVELLGDATPVNGTAPDPNAFRIHRNNAQLLTWQLIDSTRKAVMMYYDGMAAATVNYLTLNGTGIESYIMNGKTKTSAAAAPTSGAWKQGDIVYNTAPAAGGFIGWVCVVAGSPGTWKTWGAITA